MLNDNAEITLELVEIEHFEIEHCAAMPAHQTRHSRVQLEWERLRCHGPDAMDLMPMYCHTPIIDPMAHHHSNPGSCNLLNIERLACHVTEGEHLVASTRRQS